jgi:predicted transcriptional regulator
MSYRRSIKEEDIMSSIKSQAIEMLKSLPDDCNWEDLQCHIYVREKVAKGMAAAEAGEVVSQEEAERKVAEWLKSSGQIQH